MKFENRMTKSERNPKTEIRIEEFGVGGVSSSGFAIRISFGFRISTFGLFLTSTNNQ